jgi:hypothetical protein
MAANTVQQNALIAAFKVYLAPCLANVQSAEATFSGGNLGNSTSAVISPSGNSKLVVAMGILDEAYMAFVFGCGAVAQASFSPGSPLLASNTYLANLKQSYLSQVNAAMASYTKKLGDLDARIDNSNQGFWKTLLISMLLQTSKAVADALVGKLVNNFKISNLKQYTDSVATLMYDNQFLRDNFPDAQGQMMARAILENPSFRNQVQPGIFVAADAALGFNPSTLNPNDPNYYTKMAMAGSTVANPYFQQNVYVANVDAAHANATATAQQHISQGSGYKAPVTCAGSLAQQQQIDGQTKAASDLLSNRQALLTSLQQSKDLGQKVSDSDILKAQADYNNAKNAWNAIPYTVNGSNSGTGTTTSEGTIAIDICEAISSPAVLVNQGIDSIFKAFGANLTQYNSSNLPAYINTITGVASQIGSSMVLGGLKAGASAALVNEGKTVSATAGIASQFATTNNSNTLQNGIVFSSGGQTSSGSSNVTLNWQVVTALLTTASYVTVSGPGLSTTMPGPLPGSTIPNKLPLTGAINVTPAGTSTYTLTVYDPTGKVLGTPSNITLTPSTQQAYNYNPNAPAVAGAFTDKPSLDIRGPAVVFNPRGQ